MADLKLIVVDGCELQMDPLTAGNISIDTSSSEYTKIDGHGVYHGPMQLTISGYSGGAIDVPGSGSSTGLDKMQPNASYCKVDGDLVHLEDNSITITVTGQKYSGSTTVEVTQDVIVTIKSPGQSYIRTE